MARRHYSDADRAAALAVYDSTADQVHRLRDAARRVGVPITTLRRWLDDRGDAPTAEQPEHLKGGQTEDTSWWPVFLVSLAETCHVGESAKAAGVGRVTVYDHRKRHPDFAEAWDEAKTVGADTLEDEAVRRARDGWDEPVFYQGEHVSTIRKFSDTLLIFLLKGAKPDKYRERQELTGKDGAPLIPGGLSDEARRELIDEINRDRDQSAK